MIKTELNCCTLNTSSSEQNSGDKAQHNKQNSGDEAQHNEQNSGDKVPLDLLLVALNSKYTHTNLAVRYLKKFCADKNIEIFESNVNEPYDKILRAIAKFKPKFLGFSCYIWNIGLVKQLSRDLKLLSPSVKVIYGGAECYDDNLKNYCDYLVKGDGELALQKILNDSYSHGDSAIIPPTSAICDNSNYDNSNCDNSEYLGNVICEPVTSFCGNSDTEYIDSCKNKILYYESSRGCPYKCTYCLSSASNNLVVLPLPEVRANLTKFVESGVKLVKFVDRTFNADRKRAVQILEFVNDLNCDTTFHFEIAGDLIDDSFLQAVDNSKLGQFQFEIGLQSFNENTLRAIDRHIDCDKTARAVRALVELKKAHIHIDLIAGLPEENLLSFVTSFNKAYDLQAHALQLGFLKLLHGCKMRNESKKYGMIYRDTPPYEILFNDYISFDELTQLKAVEQVVEFYHNERHFKFALSLFRTKFDSYFQLFLALSRQVECQKHDSFSLHNKIRILYEFGLSLGFGEIEVENYIRFDFLTLNKDTIIKPPLTNRPVKTSVMGAIIGEQITRNEFVQEFDIDVPFGEKGYTVYAFNFDIFDVTSGNYNYRRIK